MNIFGHILTVLLRNTFTFLKMYTFDCIFEKEKNLSKLISSVAIKKIEYKIEYEIEYKIE